MPLPQTQRNRWRRRGRRALPPRPAAAPCRRALPPEARRLPKPPRSATRQPCQAFKPRRRTLRRPANRAFLAARRPTLLIPNGRAAPYQVVVVAKPYYVKFETPEDLVTSILEAVRVAKETGKVKKGTNEVTKAIERGTSRLVVIAEDVEPPEVVAHLPLLCEEQNAAYAFVPAKHDLGKALGIDITAAAASILEPGDNSTLDDLLELISKVRGGQTA